VLDEYGRAEGVLLPPARISGFAGSSRRVGRLPEQPLELFRFSVTRKRCPPDRRLPAPETPKRRRGPTMLEEGQLSMLASFDHTRSPSAFTGGNFRRGSLSPDRAPRTFVARASSFPSAEAVPSVRTLRANITGSSHPSVSIRRSGSLSPDLMAKIADKDREIVSIRRSGSLSPDREGHDRAINELGFHPPKRFPQSGHNCIVTTK
jgi:hypothetical protein